MGIPPDDEASRAKRMAREEKKQALALSTTAFIRQFETSSERGAALAVVALLDGKISASLEHALVKDDSEVTNALAPEGLLGSLGGKLRLCYLMGYLKKAMFSELRLISDIRNTFAHKFEADSFEHSLIKHRCLKLLAYTDTINFFGNGNEEEGIFQKSFYETAGYDFKNVRWAFFAECTFLAMKFQATQTIAQGF